MTKRWTMTSWDCFECGAVGGSRKRGKGAREARQHSRKTGHAVEVRTHNRILYTKGAP